MVTGWFRPVEGLPVANAEPGLLSVIYNPLNRAAVGLNG